MLSNEHGDIDVDSSDETLEVPKSCIMDSNVHVITTNTLCLWQYAKIVFMDSSGDCKFNGYSGQVVLYFKYQKCHVKGSESCVKNF